ncbi:Leucine-rich repeat receptor-like protein kinase [Quillaja saponaria]|uniref:Leucine-rich repeat receptor-like protein kinase n=1 Tax=Quillaja saponaria TaxID=32244 RepID=A0AAD7Q5L7_QUISA|nr:Leucine-rich repeat receptor-like protein kinase [Quillaja saponaria]
MNTPKLTRAIHRVLPLIFAVALTIFLHPSIAVSVNIDCGSNTSHTDEFSVAWTGDQNYINSGESKVVEYSSTVPYYMSETVMSSLRVFPTLKKNCYTINVDKGEKVLIRASFVYGNYDSKRSPPTFDLLFDGNFWTKVNTSNLQGVYHEAIYVTKKNTTIICVAQTLTNQIPFMSALELHSLNYKMYSRVDSNHALYLTHRAAAGANQTIRYPQDPYDRIWENEVGFVLTEDVKGDAVSVNASKAEDDPPPAVLRNAVTTIGTAWSIILKTGLPATRVPIYITTVTALNLSSFGLSGTLPDFSSLDALETVDFQNNSLQGQIPAFLGSLPNLKLLNLEDNRFNGTIPSSISSNRKLELIVTNNCLPGRSCQPENPALPSGTSKAPRSPTPSSGISETPPFSGTN